MSPRNIRSPPPSFPRSPPPLALVMETGEHLQPGTVKTHAPQRLAAPRRLQMGTSWSTLCRGVRDAAGEVEVGGEERGGVWERERERERTGGGWISLNLVDPLPAERRDTAWMDTCQRKRMHAGKVQRGSAIFASAAQPASLPAEHSGCRDGCFSAV